MDVLMVILRILHILMGVFWAGSMLFLAHFLAPAIADAGPAGGPVMMALMKRKVFVIIPIVALVTIISGIWMYWILSEGMHGPWIHSHMARTLGFGALVAIVTFIFGMTVVRPTQMKIFAMMTEIGPMPDGPEKQARMAAVMPLRAKVSTYGRVVAILLSIVVIAMAIARYV